MEQDITKNLQQAEKVDRRQFNKGRTKGSKDTQPRKPGAGRKNQNKENLVLCIEASIKERANKYFPRKVSGMVQEFLKTMVEQYEKINPIK